MPCNSDHMEPGLHEKESRRVANHLVYLAEVGHIKCDDWIFEAADNYYGNVSKVHELTEKLCTVLREMNDADMDMYVYNGRLSKARKLATWWEAHQEADKEREKQEAEEQKRKKVKAGALEKLNDEEKESLGVE